MKKVKILYCERKMASSKRRMFKNSKRTNGQIVIPSSQMKELPELSMDNYNFSPSEVRKSKKRMLRELESAMQLIKNELNTG